MLELKEISKCFGRVQALKGVSVKVDVGEVVGLVGENGAGKSTLMKILNGIYPPDSGVIEINGAATTLRGPQDAAAKGIGMVFQEQSLIPNLSVAENIFLGNEAPYVKFGRINWKAMGAAATRQLDKVGLKIDPRTTTSSLTFMQRQMVEIAKVLTLEEAVNGNMCILLDEPTSVLEQAEIDILFGVIRKLRERAGIIFISHRLDEVIEIADTIYVMKDGAVIERMAKADATPDRIHHLMVGREANESYYRQDHRCAPSQSVALSVQNVSKALAFSQISFDLRDGEVLALVGTAGAGSEPLIRSLFGLEFVHLGKIIYRGADITNSSPGKAVAAGIGYVPRERKIEGIIEGMSVQENICLPLGGRLAHFGLFSFSEIVRKTAELIIKLRIKTPDQSALCANLSGGNQQKVVLSKWYRTDARLFLLDHPTRGLDVGAKEDVYALIREICAAGAGVVLIADTLEEALGLAHTIIVLRDGMQTARFDNTGPVPVTPLDLIPHMV